MRERKNTKNKGAIHIDKGVCMERRGERNEKECIKGEHEEWKVTIFLCDTHCIGERGEERNILWKWKFQEWNEMDEKVREEELNFPFKNRKNRKCLRECLMTMNVRERERKIRKMEKRVKREGIGSSFIWRELKVGAMKRGEEIV